MKYLIIAGSSFQYEYMLGLYNIRPAEALYLRMLHQLRGKELQPGQVLVKMGLWAESPLFRDHSAHLCLEQMVGRAMTQGVIRCQSRYGSGDLLEGFGLLHADTIPVLDTLQWHRADVCLDKQTMPHGVTVKALSMLRSDPLAERFAAGQINVKVWDSRQEASSLVGDWHF